ncbi:uncharacterized protein LOC122267227 [Penaeus japonicus]|uniref:uncharacterized protein LOC122267227 n=1 Tax=Penaeus japonicus TaxID=27405 RepID=UPI001C713032|nr:uncharacterized protein LOC122267227 [Penaeus japonicus]
MEVQESTKEKKKAKKKSDLYRCEQTIDEYKKNCDNYRGIKLTSHTLKIWERVIEKRLRRRVQVSDQQFGFMSGRRTTDAIFALRQPIEKYREGQKDLHIVFIDLKRQEVWNCLRLKEVKEKYTLIFKDIYESSKTIVRCTAGET